jgi:sporulation protein YunB
MSMRRKWGRGFRFNLLGGGSFQKPGPRRWGRGFVPIKGGSSLKPAPRKWGRRSWLASPGRTSAPPPRRFVTGTRKPRRRMKSRTFWLITLACLVFLVVQTLLFLDRELRVPLMFLAKIRISQMATEAINAAITDEIAQTADADKLIQWKTNPEGKVSGFVMDYKEQMRLTARTIEVVSRVLKEHEDVPEHIPIGHALNSPFISSLGPKVSVTFHPASNVKVDVETEQSEAGINMLLVQVYIRIQTQIAVIIPFDQEPEALETRIPLSYVMVVGDVPTYYYDGNGNPIGNGASQAPSIALPGKSEVAQTP